MCLTFYSISLDKKDKKEGPLITNNTEYFQTSVKTYEFRNFIILFFLLLLCIWFSQPLSQPNLKNDFLIRIDFPQTPNIQFLCWALEKIFSIHEVIMAIFQNRDQNVFFCLKQGDFHTMYPICIIFFYHVSKH